VKVLGAILLFLLTTFVAGVLAPLCVEDLRELLPKWSVCLVRWAAQMMPVEHQERCADEWEAHLNDIPGQLTKLGWAIGAVLGAPKVARELRGLPTGSMDMVRCFLAAVMAGALALVRVMVRGSAQQSTETPSTPEGGQLPKPAQVVPIGQAVDDTAVVQEASARLARLLALERAAEAQTQRARAQLARNQAITADLNRALWGLSSSDRLDQAQGALDAELAALRRLGAGDDER
jgi:hypothetical protein